MRKLERIGIVLLTLWLAACAPVIEAERDPVAIDPDYPPGMIEASFQSHGARLNALHYTANGAGPHPTILLLHGYPGNEKNLDLAQYFRRDGWNVFFFHYRGAWGSEGNFSFLNAAQDVAAALAYLREHAAAYRVDKDRIVIVGHSMGGMLTLAGASDDSAISCAVTLAAAPLELPPGFATEERAAFYRAYADTLIMLHGHDGSNVIAQDAEFKAAYPLSKVTAGLHGKKLFMLGASYDTAVPIAIHEMYAERFGNEVGIELTTQVYGTDHGFNTHRVTLARRITGWLDDNCR